jgi:DNA (cytosine-5)-methyltransferase 1
VNVEDLDLAEATAADLLAAADLDEAPTVVAGGPPCQGFSSVGARRHGDGRNSLVSKFGLLIAEMRPRAFLFENVEGFLTAEGGARVFDLLDPVLEAGYHVQLRKVNAANYGVPQLRKRVIGVGALGGDPILPLPTHFAFGAPGAQRVIARAGMPDVPTLADALQGLPAPGSPGAPDDHGAPRVSELDRDRIAALMPGQTMRDLPEHLHHESYRRRAFRRVMDGTPTERRGGAPAGYAGSSGRSRRRRSLPQPVVIHPSERGPTADAPGVRPSPDFQGLVPL